MRNLAKFLASGAVSLFLLAPALAQAATVHVTFTVIDPAQNLDVRGSWDQASNPTPAGPSVPPFTDGQYTDIPIFNYHSTGATPTATYTDVVWQNAGNGGGFSLFNLSNGGVLDYNVLGPQAYTGTESAPVFGAGSFEGTDTVTNAPATYTLTVATVGVPTPVPGAGLAGLAALALAGLFARTRRA